MKAFSIIPMLFIIFSNYALAMNADRDGKLWEGHVEIRHATLGYRHGQCSYGFLIEIPRGFVTVELSLKMAFVGKKAGDLYIDHLTTTLTGSGAGRIKKEYVESKDLCFDVSKIEVLAAKGKVQGKKVDFLLEDKIKQSNFVPVPIEFTQSM